MSLSDVFVYIICAILYFLPTIISRNNKNFGSVFVINFFLGWCVIGWIVSLSMSLKRN